MPDSGETVLCLVDWNDIKNWITGYLGEEDLFFDILHDEVIEGVTHWIALPDPETVL